MQRQNSSGLWITIGLLVFGATVSAPALGTTFVLMNEEDLAESADAALIGTVTSVDADIEDDRIRTYVAIAPDAVLFGDVAAGEVVLSELGGQVSGRRERVFGVPTYTARERVLVFVSLATDGSLRTTAMAMGKYRLSAGHEEGIVAARTFDEGSVVLDRESGALVTSSDGTNLYDLLERVQAVRPIRMPTEDIEPTPDLIEESGSYTYLGKPARWFEPDEGVPVEFLVCPSVDEPAPPSESRLVVAEALAAWSDDPLSALTLTHSVMAEPTAFDDCSGPNRVVFDDPFEEIDDPTNCSGIVALGGYCALDHETRTVNGQTFRRIRVGRVTFGDGWSDCPFWNSCNMAEIATHEVGHAIGLGHSTDKAATMAPVAQLDGRCGGLRADDRAGLRSLYPHGAVALSPTPTRTATRRPTPTLRTTPSTSPTVTKRPTRTPRGEPTPPHNEGIRTPPPTPTPQGPGVGVADMTPTATPADNGICEGDADGDRRVTVDEIIAVVTNSLQGCRSED